MTSLIDELRKWSKNRRRLGLPTRPLDEAARRLEANDKFIKELLKKLRDRNKIYVATFHGDISEFKPMVDDDLESLLRRMAKEHGWGEVTVEEYDDDRWEVVSGPDPEDDKIEVWEYDAHYKNARIVWGFWGWHWAIPEGLEQGKLPDQDVSLFKLALNE